MFWIKQCLKMILQNFLLPVIYNRYRKMPVRKGTVIFADSHHDRMPFSMLRMYETVKKLSETGENGGYEIDLFATDFDSLSFPELAKYLFRFMKKYATAEYVFICDYFLPVSSCKKRPETKVVQLWHSCGLMKKIAYDTGEDIPKGYRGNMFGNYTYLTLSSMECIPVHEKALKLSRDHIFATGVSRTDFYFDSVWNSRCRENFFRQHPDAQGRRIAVWAPTFRGNAAMPRLEGYDAVKNAAEKMKDTWFFVIKAHPHIDAHGKISNSEIPTEELFAVADVLITDYSSVLFDFLLYHKSAVLFAPDLWQYEKERGFYLDYGSIPFPVAKTEEELESALNGCQTWYDIHREDIEKFTEMYVGACDGHSTERIMKLIGMKQ